MTSSLAAFLSMLMVSTSASASVCDLSCWLRQAHSDCHSGGPTTSRDAGMPMSSMMAMDMSANENPQMPVADATPSTAPKDSTPMPPGMDMRPGRSDNPMAADAGMHATPGRLMSMSPRPEMAAERFQRALKSGMRTNTMHHHPGNLSSCTHETCSQISASVSPPRVEHAQPSFLHSAPISPSNPVDLWADSQLIRPGIPPLEVLPAEGLATILRI